ncbi:amidase [Chitinasiproducens palmae]|uniref:Amidase n=1 Tax=Chitinasiproducens palmae TaxID=1770053 RepID=A0A1H2PKU2_9BURK|nr:amidase [Chitinasiproducens palmae]SDV46980.1 amidase [Chitinasiproducens palmae]
MNELIARFELNGAHSNGLTIAVKDCIDIAGMPTQAGSRALADAPPAAQHAEVVSRLLAAGWQIVGKANMHELAFGMTGINAFTGTPTNPQAPERVPGGSSSGSAAAVGAALVDAAIGTDTGGSIRGPAAFCGVIGLKPTFGRVSRQGVTPRESTLDCVGPFARDMKTLVAVMQAIAPDFDLSPAAVDDAAARTGQPFTLGVYRGEADPAINAAVAAALARTGLAQRPVDLTGIEDAFDAGLTVINAETARAFGEFVGRNVLGADLEARLALARNTSADDLARAETVRERFTAQVDEQLRQVDAIVLPTMPSLPITVDEARNGVPVIRTSFFIRPFNLTGHPALSLPIPIEGSDIKAGLQIVGRHGADEKVCEIAAFIERAIANRA